MTEYPSKIKKLINKGIEPHDAIILSEVIENLKNTIGGKGKLISYNHELKLFERGNREEQKQGRNLDPIDFWQWRSGAFYKTDAKGRITLLWCDPYNEPGCPFLIKIPDSLLDLSHLKYLWLICVHKGKIIPTTLKSNDVFEVQIRPINDKSPPFLFDSLKYAAIGSKFIDLNDFFELEIIRKELFDQIRSDDGWLFKEAFKKE